ncbi:MAG: Hpt domain-containing protein [Micrococcus sp.]|nr:Hpt domain-containing protein [Micrococcus sp.]
MTTAPVIDTDALGRLREQLGDPDVLCGFIRRYEALLDQRVERLHHALNAQDHDDWMDAILSLKTSSAMAGAAALSALAAELQDHLARRPPEPIRWPVAESLESLMTKLRHLARETAHQLRLFLDRLTGAS